MYIAAYALGDPSVTVEQVTPAVFPAGALFPSEVDFSLKVQLYLVFLVDSVFLISYL